jgi:hypothetical protein
MQGPYLRKYGVQATLDFCLYETDGVDMKVDAVHASGDTVLMKDEGAEANTTNGFVDEGKAYSITLTATEMEFARGMVHVCDQGTKTWLDTTLVIETYGHASAQHAFDLDTAQQDVNVAALDDDVITAAKIAADAITSSELAASAVSEIADQVWDELMAGHQGAGTFGDQVANVLATASAVWTYGTRSLTSVTNIIDGFFTRDWMAITGEAARSLLNALRQLRNRVEIVAGVLKVYKEDDSTLAWQAPVTTDSDAEPVTGVNPSG